MLSLFLLPLPGPLDESLTNRLGVSIGVLQDPMSAAGSALSALSAAPRKESKAEPESVIVVRPSSKNLYVSNACRCGWLTRLSCRFKPREAKAIIAAVLKEHLSGKPLHFRQVVSSR